MMKIAMIFVNFKTYKEGTGERAVELVRICKEVERETKVRIVPIVQTVDIFRINQAVEAEVWAQHVDFVAYGSNTGSVLPEAIVEAGAKGTLLNHSEKKITDKEKLKNLVGWLKDLHLEVMLCCGSIEEGEELEELRPDFLAYEPPDLIGSQEYSVSTAQPKIVREFAQRFSRLKVVVGAGVKNKKDVLVARELGAQGVLVASDVMLAADPRKELLDLAWGIK